ncbi:hypothetical protein [Sphingobium sp. CR28]|uniref:hypothetical protein n=1 Tax=Sphingobium sp. CR28 TaxID=3400272 RepID=UPI003FF0F6A7
MNKTGAKGIWQAGLEEDASGWDEPAFPERRPTPMPERLDMRRIPVKQSYSADALIFSAVVLASAGWFGFLLFQYAVIGSNLDPVFESVWRVAMVCLPLILIVMLGFLTRRMLASRLREREWQRFPREAKRAAQDAAEAANRLSEAHGQMQRESQSYVALAQDAGAAMQNAAGSLSAESARVSESMASSTKLLAALTEQFAILGEIAPKIEDRLATLAETLNGAGRTVADHGRTLEEQMSAAAMIAEEARLQLQSSADMVRQQIADLRAETQGAGEELSSLSELASARIDFTIERVNSMLTAAGQKIEARGGELDTLVSRSTQAIETAASHSLDRFSAHGDEIAARLDSLGSRVDAQGEKSKLWLDSVSSGIAQLADQFDALEASALSRTDKLSNAMMSLSGETRRLGEALEEGDTSSEKFIKRVEALILALDSSIRELDESLPAAITRVEHRMTALTGTIASTGPAVEAVEAVAAGVVSRLQESDGLAKAHFETLTAALKRSDGALGTQKKKIEELAGAIEAASGKIGVLSETVGPQMVEALVRVRETADAAAARAREAIGNAVPDAANALGAASAAAMEQAMAKSVTEQLDRLAVVADNAVKAAQRSTEQLSQQMLTLTDSSTELERRISANAQVIETQDRERLSYRSNELIDALNSRAFDVSKWLDQDVSQVDWSNYLKGDHGFFARRAVRLVSNAEAKDIHRIYAEDDDFREHVNRYIADFEALLKAVLGAREGSALAVTMLSSDIGKLYVALAQAIDRLPPR